MLRLWTAIVLLTVFSALALGAGVQGKWKGRVLGREGPRAVYFLLEADGERLTGKMVDGHGDNPISEGRITGDQLSFTIVYDFSGDKVKRLYRGTLSGDEIHFTCQAESGENKKEFTARRMQ
jgi:hypothetical protein